MAKELMPGDQVSFLNEDGGGKVLSIIDDQQVMVELDEGFEIPVPRNQLVKVKDFTKAPEPGEKAEETETVVPRKPQGEPGLYLAFDPAKGGDLLELYLVNNTAFNIYFTIFEEAGSSSYLGISRGELESLGTQMVKRYNQSRLNEWRPLVIQALSFANETQTYPQPLHHYFKPNPKAFFKALKQAPLLDREAYLFKVESSSAASENPPSQPKKQAFSKTIQKTEPQKPVSDDIEWPEGLPPHTVDLHIEKLVKHPSELEHSEILEYQMKCFEHALDRGLAWGYDRMLFIHGIGNGVLRERIHLYLRRFQHVRKFKEGPQPGTTEVWF